MNMATRKKRDIYGELEAGVRAMKAHRQGKLTLKTYKVEPAPLPRLPGGLIQETRERLGMSQGVFARRLRVNRRTLERWEQGRSKPNDQAVALILLVREFPDTLDRLERIQGDPRTRARAAVARMRQGTVGTSAARLSNREVEAATRRARIRRPGR